MTMKYLFLILVCYAVKCEDVGNNYFVIKMPEDIRQQDIKDFKKPFQVYWNVPTMQCASKKIPFQNLFERFGIIQNDNDRFIGNKIVVIYDEKDFPAIKINKTNGKNILKNGGVPQEGNLEDHLIAFENDLNTKIPDPYFDGIAIIDFESWRPVFLQNFGTLVPHKKLSIEIEKQLHNWWPKLWIEKEATLRFETAARRFMQTTLTRAKEMRPNALWGYYGYPYCFNMRGRDMAEKCAKNVDKENDSIYWLWAESTALFPSLYSSVSLTSSQLSSFIKGRVKEASRVRGIDTPIFPYFWYRYRDAGFMTEKDLEAALTTLYQSDASGLLIWGSSNDVNTVDKCNKLLKYVETVFGPKIAKYTKPIKNIHSDSLENKEIYLKETSTAYDEFSHSRSTKSLNKDKMFSTETTTVKNKYTKADEISETVNNDVMSSTESAIKYNVYTNSDDLQTLNNFDLSLSLLGSSFNSEYRNINQSIPTLNNDETFTTESAITYDKNTYIDEKNGDLYSFSSETSTAYRENTNSDQSSNTQNNDEISSSDETTKAYNEYSNTEENVPTLNNDDTISSSESLIFDYENSDHSTTTLNNDKVSLDNISITNFVDTISNDNVISSSKSSIFDYLNSDHITTTLYYEETSLGNISPKNFVDIISNDNEITSSEFSNFDNENSDHGTTTLNNEETSLGNTLPKKIVDIINNDNEITSSEFSNFDYENSDHGTTTLNNDETSLGNISPKKFLDIINNDNEITSSKFSNFNYENSDHSITTINRDEISLIPFSTVDNSNRDKSSQTLNYEGTTIIFDKYLDTEENVQTLNNDDKISSSESSIIHDGNSDNSTKTLNNDEMSSKGTSIIYDDVVIKDQTTDSLNTVKNIKETFPALDEISHTDKSTDILNYGEIITDHIEFKSTGNDFLNKNTLLYSSEDRFDYLIEVDNSTNIESFKQSEYKDSANVEVDDYLILVRNFQNVQNLKENITELETVYKTTQADNNQEKATISKHFRERSNDLVIRYIDQKHELIEKEDSSSTKGESLQSINLLNSDGDRSDYLIKIDNSTNIETYNQSDNTIFTNADDDYLVIVTDFNNNKYKKNNILDNNLNLDSYSKTQTESNLVSDTTVEDFSVTDEDLDPIVAYISKTIDNMKFQDSNEEISTEDESFNNVKVLNSDGDTFNYLIKRDNFTNTETDKQYEYRDSTNADNDYILIIKNLDD